MAREGTVAGAEKAAAGREAGRAAVEREGTEMEAAAKAAGTVEAKAAVKAVKEETAA